MTDPRYAKLASNLINHSIHLEKGEKVLIEAFDLPEAMVIALVRAARARALIAGRGYVLPDDVKRLAVPVLAHRLVLRPELWLSGSSGAEVVSDVLGSVPTPSTSGAPALDPAPR